MKTDTITRPRLPITWWGLAIRALVAFVIVILGNEVRSPLRGIAASRINNETTLMVVEALLFMITPVVVILAVVAWMRWVERASIRITGLFDVKRIGPGVLGGTLIVAVAFTVAWAALIAMGMAVSDAELEEMGGAAPEVGIAAVLAAVFYTFVRAFLLQGLPEELLYRGWLFSVSRDRPWLTFWWTTLAFMIIHLISSGGQESWVERFYYLLLPLGMGMLAGAVVLWRGSMWWAVGTHGGMHICLPAALMLVPVEMGPLTWFTVGAAQAVLAVIILWRWQVTRRRENV